MTTAHLGAHGTGELEDHDDGYQCDALLVTADQEVALVAALLNAVVGFCLGCETYLVLRRLAPVRA